MKKILALLLCAACLLSLCACGASAAKQDVMAAEEMIYEEPAEPAYATADYADADEAYSEAATATDWDNGTVGAAADPNTTASGSGNGKLSGLKIIKTGNLSIATESFEETDAFIRSKVAAYEGLLADSTVSGTAGQRWASYTVRIPSASFDSFFYAVAGGCAVTYQSISSEDVTENYTDLETRLETNQKKYQRLLELLDKAETLTDVYSIQSEISNVEYEIDRITGTLNSLDSRVAYSTIYIDVNEQTRTVVTPEDSGFGTKLRVAFKNGTADAVEGLQDLVLWLAESWFGILVFLIVIGIIALIVKLILRSESRSKEKRAKKAGQGKPSNPTVEPSDTSDAEKTE